MSILDSELLNKEICESLLTLFSESLYSSRMKLIDYCNSTDRGGQTRLAKALSISPVLVCTWANGIRPIPVERCVQIEQVTEGAVTRKDLRPDDWQKIWPELIEKAAA